MANYIAFFFVMLWPYVQYGQTMATISIAVCYKDVLSTEYVKVAAWWRERPQVGFLSMQSISMHNNLISLIPHSLPGPRAAVCCHHFSPQA